MNNAAATIRALDPDAAPRTTALPLRDRALWIAGLGAFFFLVYGTCNWYTSLRPGVGSFHWDWERKLPFVPQLILPYMSLDLFFAGAILLCSRNQIGVHAKRVVTAILVAAACYLLFPLRFDFPRPATGGFNGLLFDWLGLDQPYNQAPSLHIALRSIVWAPYGRRVRGPLRWLLIAWFALIGLSAVLTYQHHVIDVIGGEILAVLVFYAFPWSEPVRETARGSSNPKLACIYGASSAALAALGYLLQPWGILLFWPALSLALVTAAYAGAGPRVFRKHNGHMAWAAAVLLGPYLLAARITHLLYRGTSDPWNRLAPNLFIGRRLTPGESQRLAGLGVTAVLDLTCEYTEKHRNGFQYRNVQIVDHTLPGEAELRAAIGFIEQHSRGGVVYVHCALGFSRSAGILAAYLLESKIARSSQEAEAMVRKARPQAIISPGWAALLRGRTAEALP